MPVPRPPRPWTSLALILGVAILAAHGPVLLGARTWSDPGYVAEVVPARIAAGDAIASGHLPGWWERAGLGAPLWAEPAHGAAYPGDWTSAIAPSRGAWLADVGALVHVLIAALGVALLSRRLGADDLGALAAGAWFAVSDVATGAVLGGAIGAVAWLPWAAWGADAIARGPTRRGAIALALALGMMLLAGRWAIAGDGAVLAIAIVATRALSRRSALAWCGIAIALGVALGAALLVPAMLHLSGPVASSAGARPAGSGWSLLEVVLPHARDLGGGASPGTGLWIGGAVIGFAVASRQRALGLIAAGFAIATTGVLVPWDALVGIDRAAASPADHGAAAAVLLAAMAGLGFTALGKRAERGTVRAVAIAAGALVVAVVALGAARPMLARHLAGQGDLDAAVAQVDGVLAHAALAAAVAVAALGLALAAARRGWPWAVPAAAVVVLGHAVIVGRLAHPTSSRGELDAVPTLLEHVPDGAGSDARVALAATGLTPRLYRPERMTGATDPHETLEGASASRWGYGATRWPAPGRRIVEDTLWQASAVGGTRFFDRFAVDLALVPANSAIPGGFSVLGERGEWALVAIAAKRPRVFLAPATRWFPDDASATAAMFPIGDPRSLPLGVVARVGDGTDAGDPAAPPVPCSVRAPAPERVVVHCDGGDAGGTIAIADAWAPGWSVAVDGADAPLARVDVAARGVEVGPGAHDAVFRYVPPGATVGAWISIGAALALIALGLAPLLRSRR